MAPEKEVLFQEGLSANISQRKQPVDGQEQSAVERHQLQSLQARLRARQHLWVWLPQPISIRLESKKRAFGEDSRMRQRLVEKTAKKQTVEDIRL